MTQPSLPKKLMTNLFLLVYLLIGAGMGNALVLCQESEAFSHFEYNLAGSCLAVCLPEARSHGSGAPTLQPPFAWSSADDCQDRSISLDHSLAPGAGGLLAEVVAPALPGFHCFSNYSAPVTDLVSANLVARPPPSLALITLRTTVLLI